MIITSFNGKAERRLTAGQTAKCGRVGIGLQDGLKIRWHCAIPVRVRSPVPIALSDKNDSKDTDMGKCVYWG